MQITFLKKILTEGRTDEQKVCFTPKNLRSNLANSDNSDTVEIIA